MKIKRFYQNLSHGVVSLRITILSICILFFLVSMIFAIGTMFMRFSVTNHNFSILLLREMSCNLFSPLTQAVNTITTTNQNFAQIIQNHTPSSSDEKFIFAQLKSMDLALKVTNNPLVKFVFFMHPDGRILINSVENSLETTLPLDNNKAKWAININPNASFQLGTIPNTQQPALIYTVPIVNNEHTVTGVLGSVIPIHALQQSIDPLTINQQSVAFIANNQNKLILFNHSNQSSRSIDWVSQSLKLYHRYQNQTQTTYRLIYKKPPLPARLYRHVISLVFGKKIIDLSDKKTTCQIQGAGYKEFLFELKDRNYLASYTPFLTLPSQQQQWVLGVVFPQTRLVDFAYNMLFEQVFLLTALLIPSLWLINRFVKVLVRPFRLIIHEIQKIKEFELDGDFQIKSHILEIFEIGNAIQSMRLSLRNFKKFLPSTIVKQLIKTGHELDIGGEKKTLVILFSDIQNFTTITEHTKPEALIRQLSEYIETLSDAIVQEKGTIDKYIGDAIMAFWGAPRIMKNPCHHAARAALKCQRLLQRSNQQWKAEHKPCFITRIGINFGEAIVGNYGSKERLNYTALGDEVNTASRLEGTNAIYGTNIMVSKAMYDQIKDQFLLRFVDHVSLKGKEQGTFIYELLGEKNDTLAFSLDHYQKQFERAHDLYRQQKWSAAINTFQACLDIYPDDTVAPVFIKRCEYLEKNQPNKNWDGMWKITAKP